jgi:hypothetical protein
VGHRWFTVSRALLAQTLQSLVGHRAAVAVAFTEQGFRVFLMEKEKGGTHKIYTWPEGQNYHIPASDKPFHEDEGLRILVDLVRIGTSIFDLNSLKTYVKSSSSRVKEGPSSPASSAEKEGNSRGEERRSTEPSNKRANLDGDEVFRVKATDGSIMKLKSLCLSSRFSEEELDEIDRLEKKLTYKVW